MNHKLKNISLISTGVLAGIGISLGINALAQKNQTSIPIDDVDRISAAFQRISQEYVNPVTDKKLLEGAIRGMVAELDPHSSFFNQQELKEFMESTEGKFVGLGIEISKDKNAPVKVMTVFEDSPAHKAGLLAGDAIIKINGSFSSPLSQNEAVKRMRGEPKTSVTITIDRPGVDKPFDLTIVRDVIKTQSVKSKVLENNYGYVRINQFQKPTFVDLVKHLESLQKQGANKGLVLDLRGNPGGSLNVAVGVAGAFINQPKPLVVYSVGRAKDSRVDYYPTKTYLDNNSPKDPDPDQNWAALQRVPVQYKTIPMVVLTDCYSASASELVAGALQDYNRTKVLGTRTYGKGSVQSVLFLDETTALKLTTATYRTPKGRSIQAKGITPDYVVPQTPEGDIAHCSYREADLDNHLVVNPNDEKKSHEADLETPEIKDDKKSLTPERMKELRKYVDFGSSDDYQLKQALNLLKGQPVAVVNPENKAQKEASKETNKDTSSKAPEPATKEAKPSQAVPKK